MVWLTVRDTDGNVVRRIKGSAKKGFHRVNWDLRFPDSSIARPANPDGGEPSGYLVSPGQYTVELSKRVRGQTTQLVAPKPFAVEKLRDGALPPQEDAAEFWDQIAAFDRSVTAAASTLNDVQEKLGLLSIAVQRAQASNPTALDNRLQSIREEVNFLDAQLNGNPARNALAERTQPTVRSRLGAVQTGLFASTYGPTQTHRDQFAFAQAEFGGIRDRLRALTESAIPAFEAELLSADAPYVPGAELP